MITGGRLAAAALLVLAALLFGRSAVSGVPGIAAFYGRYEGTADIAADDGGEIRRRDLAVTIAPEGDRFRIDWQTSTRLPDGELKTKTYSIMFEPTARDGIFGSKMRTDMFGNRVPLDPLKGDPYVWCRIAGDTLTLYAMVITDSGGYDLQVYDRTLTKTGLQLQFTRLREGEAPKKFSAVLQKVAAEAPAR